MKCRSALFAAVLIFIMVVLDQLIKYRVTQELGPGERLDLLPFLALYHIRNPGIAFSLLSSFNNADLIILTIAIILFVFWLLWSTEIHKKLARLGYLFVIGGALGNLVDRLRFHYVTDYVLFHIGKWSFAIFNLADTFITTGAICIIVSELWSWYQEKFTSADE